MKKAKNFLPQFKPIITALAQYETYIYLISGIFLIAGLYKRDLNFLFYFSFVFPSYKCIKGRNDFPGLFYFLLPYFLVQGIEVWNYIFPYYTGIVLALLMAELFARLINNVFNRIKLKHNTFLILPALFFLYDFFFQEMPIIQQMQIVPLLSPVYNHIFLLKAVSIYGGHTVLFLVIAVIAGVVSVLAERKHYFIHLIFILCWAVLLLVPSLNTIYITNEISNNDKKIKIAVVQSSAYEITGQQKVWKSGDYSKAILEHYSSIINKERADIYVLPEVVIGNLDTDNKLEGDARAYIMDTAKKLDALVVCLVKEGSSLTKSKNDRFITALLVSEDSVIGKSRKRNLVPGNESSNYTSGKEYDIIDTSLGKMGISICYDTNYGTIGKLKENGAEIILSPFNDSDFCYVYHNIHRFYSVINAALYKIPIAAANKDGISQLIDNSGSVIKEIGLGEIGVISFEYSLNFTPSVYLIFGRYFETALFIVISAALVLYLLKFVRKKG